MTISEYVKNKEIKMYTVAFLKDGKLLNLVNDKLLTNKELDKLYPTTGRLIINNKALKGDNPDKTKIPI